MAEGACEDGQSHRRVVVGESWGEHYHCSVSDASTGNRQRRAAVVFAGVALVVATVACSLLVDNQVGRHDAGQVPFWT